MVDARAMAAAVLADRDPIIVCVSLFYVIDTGSIRPRARIPPSWGLPIYPPPLAQTLAM